MSFLVRDKNQRKDGSGVRRFETFKEALKAPLDGMEEPVIQIGDREPVALLDLDAHTFDRRPTDAELRAWGLDLRPQPQFLWLTQGSGIRAVYVGKSREEAQRAAAIAALSFPIMDMACDTPPITRHPKGQHSKYPGKSCSLVTAPSPTLKDVPPETAEPGPKEIEEWLRQRGQKVGARYAHGGHCPIQPGLDRGSEPCVSVTPNGIKCYRCSHHGITYPGSTRPGWVPFRILIGGRSLDLLRRMAREFVHWAHALVVLRWVYRGRRLSARVLRLAYESALADAMADADDPRRASALSQEFRILRGEGGLWVDLRSLEVARVTKYTALALPWAKLSRTVSVEGVATFRYSVSGPRVDRVLGSGALDGYFPVRAIAGVLLRPEVLPAEVVPLSLPPRIGGRPFVVPRHKDLLSWGDAFGRLAATFPGLNEKYLLALVCAAICAEGGNSRPPMLQVSGPTGSGKGETLRIGGGLMGSPAAKLDLASTSERFRRQVGTALVRGDRFLLVDEISRIKKLHGHLSKLLELGSPYDWRPLYGRDVSSAFGAVVVLAHLFVPDVISQSPELGRRIRHVPLLTRVPEWAGRCPAGNDRWRDQSEENARAADSILTHCLERCRGEEFAWDRVADQLGLEAVNESDDGGLDEEALVALYCHCRDVGGRSMSAVGKWRPEAGWVDFTSRAAQEITERLLSDHESGDTRSAWYRLGNDLSAYDWPRLLGLSLPIRCVVKLHGAAVVGKFTAGHQRNEQLPPPTVAALRQLASGSRRQCVSPNSSSGNHASAASAFSQPPTKEDKEEEGELGRQGHKNADAADALLPGKDLGLTHGVRMRQVPQGDVDTDADQDLIGDDIVGLLPGPGDGEGTP
jgi:hypothetical protein